MSHPQLNPPGRPTRFRTTRALVLALLLAGLAPALDGKAPADSLRPDPVKEFVKLRDARQARQMARKWSLGDVSRILTAQTFDYVEPEVRQALIDSFDQKVREVVKERDPGQQLALASRVAEMAVGSRSEGAGADTRSSSSVLRKALAHLAPELVVLTRSPNASVRNAAALALGSVEANPDQAAAVLQRLLADPDVSTRRAAARALGNMVQVVSQVTRSRLIPQELTPRLGPGAGAPGGRLGVPQEKRPAEVTRREEEPFRTALKVVPVAAGGVNDPDLEVRRLSVTACGLASRVLVDLIPRPDPQLPLDSREIIRAQHEEAQPLLAEFQRIAGLLGRAARDPDPEIRTGALRVLQDLAAVRRNMKLREAGTPQKERKEGIIGRALPPANGPKSYRTQFRRTALLSRPDGSGEPSYGIVSRSPKLWGGEGRAALPVGRSLPRLSPDAVASTGPVVLAQRVEDRADPATRALNETLDAVVADLRDPNPQVRLAAIDVLETIGVDAAPAVPAILAALRDPNKFVRWAAARTLGQMAQARAEAEQPPFEPDRAVPGLVRLLFDPDMDVRLTAAGALEYYGPYAKAAVPTLERFVGLGDPEVRIAILHALEGIGTDAASALGAVAGELNPRREPDPRVRRIAAEVLGRFGRLAAPYEDALRQALNDSDETVRRAASAAILSLKE